MAATGDAPDPEEEAGPKGNTKEGEPGQEPLLGAEQEVPEGGERIPSGQPDPGISLGADPVLGAHAGKSGSIGRGRTRGRGASRGAGRGRGAKRGRSAALSPSLREAASQLGADGKSAASSSKQMAGQPAPSNLPAGSGVKRRASAFSADARRKSSEAKRTKNSGLGDAGGLSLGEAEPGKGTMREIRKLAARFKRGGDSSESESEASHLTHTPTDVSADPDEGGLEVEKYIKARPDNPNIGPKVQKRLGSDLRELDRAREALLGMRRAAVEQQAVADRVGGHTVRTSDRTRQSELYTRAYDCAQRRENTRPKKKKKSRKGKKGKKKKKKHKSSSGSGSSASGSDLSSGSFSESLGSELYFGCAVGAALSGHSVQDLRSYAAEDDSRPGPCLGARRSQLRSYRHYVRTSRHF